MRRLFLIALVFIPMVGATLIVRQWRSENDRPRIRMEEATDDTPITSSLSLSESSGRRSFFVSRQRVMIDGAEHEVPSRYWFMEEWHKNPDGSLEAQGITMVLLPTPRTTEDVALLPSIQVTDGAKQQIESLRRAQKQHDSITAKEARLAGGKGVSDARTVALKDTVRVVVGDAGQQATLESDDALVSIEANGLQSLKVAGAFALKQQQLTLRAQGLWVTPDELIASSHVHLEVSDGSSLSLQAGGPLKVLPRSQGASRGGWRHLQFDEAQLSAAGGVDIKQGAFRVRGQDATCDLEAQDTNGEQQQALIKDIEVTGDVSLETDNWLTTTDKAVLHESASGALTADLSGSPTVIRHRSGVGQLRASAKGPVQIHEVKAQPSRAAHIVLALNEEVELLLKDGSPQDGSLRCNKAAITLLERPSNVAGDAEGTGFGFERCAATDRVEGSFHDLDVRSESLTLEAKVNKAGRLIGHDLHSRGATRLNWTSGDSNSATQTLHSSELLQVYSAASPFATSHFSAEGSVRLSEKTTNARTRTLTAHKMTGSLVASMPKKPTDQRSRTLDNLIATGDVNAAIEDSVAIRCDQLRLDSNATLSTAIGNPAVLTYGTVNKKQTIRAPRVVWNNEEKLLVADGGVEGELLFPELLLLSVERKKKGAITSGPFATVPLRTEIPWQLTAGRINARMQQEDGSLVLQQLHSTGGLKLTNARQSIEAEVLVADMLQGTGWAQGKPVRIRVTKEHGEQSVVDTVVAPWVLMTDDSILLKGACHATLHLRRPGGVERPVPLERLVVTCEQDILIGQSEAFFSGRTHMIRGNPDEEGLDMKCDRATVRLGGNNQDNGGIDRIEGFGHVEIVSGSLNGFGDAVVFDDKERLVHMSSLNGVCRMTLGSGITEKSSAICFNMRTRSLKSYNVRGDLRK